MAANDGSRIHRLMLTWGTGHPYERHPEIAQLLTLTLTEQPTTIPSGERHSYATALTNISDHYLGFMLGFGSGGTIWSEDGAVLMGGGEGWSGAAARFGELDAGATMQLSTSFHAHVRRTADQVPSSLYPLAPLPPGVYQLRAAMTLDVLDKGEWWEATVLSPFYRVLVTPA